MSAIFKVSKNVILIKILNLNFTQMQQEKALYIGLFNNKVPIFPLNGNKIITYNYTLIKFCCLYLVYG